MRNNLLALLLFASLAFAPAAPAQEVERSIPEQQNETQTLDAQAATHPRQAEHAAEKDYASFPTPDDGYVTDLANLLTLDQEERIEQWLWDTEEETGVEIIVVTIDSISDYPGTPNAFIEEFARGLFDNYGIGNMPADNGVLLLVSVRDRRARIELGKGYRTRDADARRIVDQDIIPHFREEDYAAGITQGVKSIMLEFANVKKGIPWLGILYIALIPVLALIAISLFRKGKRGWGWVCVGLLILLILGLLIALFSVMKHTARRPGGPGGLGGFGGGSSGGGGATGSW